MPGHKKRFHIMGIAIRKSLLQRNKYKIVFCCKATEINITQSCLARTRTVIEK